MVSGHPLGAGSYSRGWGRIVVLRSPPPWQQLLFHPTPSPMAECCTNDASGQRPGECCRTGWAFGFEAEEAAAGEEQTQKEWETGTTWTFSVGGQKGRSLHKRTGAQKGTAPAILGTAGYGAAVTFSGPLSMGFSVLTKGWSSLSIPSSSLLLKEKWGKEGSTSALVTWSLTDVHRVHRHTCEHNNACTLIYLPGCMEFPLLQRMPPGCCMQFREPFRSVHWPLICPDGYTMAVAVDCKAQLAFSVFLVLFPIFTLSVTGVQMVF